jgi:hypothetical protein
MEAGNYKHYPKWSKYEVDMLPLYMYNPTTYGNYGCGSTALSIITGINPVKIQIANKNRHYSDEFMLKYLRQHKIKCIKMTKCNLTNQKDWQYPINARHVLLVSQLVKKAEATWKIIYQGISHHNFLPSTFSVTSMLNNPVCSSYVLFKPEWKVETISNFY